MEPVKRGLIYLLTSPSYKTYVGQTIQPFEKRMKQHHYSAKTGCDACPALCRAIRKYGWESFTKEIIVECDQDQLDQLEVYYIKECDSMKHGYNILPGGSLSGHNDETRRKMSEHNRIYREYLLPMYCSMYYKGNVRGFRCIRPECEPVIICDSRTMTEKYEHIFRIYEMTPEEIKEFNANRKLLKNKQRKLDAGDEYPLMDYLTYKESRESFIVRVPKCGQTNFGKKYSDKKSRYEAAVKYRAECMERMQFRD